MRLSYSALSKFDQCPRQFQHLYVLRDVQQAPSAAADQGVAIHEALEHAVRDKTPLPADMEALAPYVGLLARYPGQVLPEVALAAGHHLEPCAYEHGYIVGKLDVLCMDGSKALILDWKTGKPRDNALQMRIYAWLAMLHYPEIQDVVTRPVYLYHPEKRSQTATHTRASMSTLRREVQEKAVKVELAVERGTFPARPSALCGWCPVKTCQHNPEHGA